MKNNNQKNIILPRSFYARDTIEVARDLIGKIIIRDIDGIILAARIVETEAYPGKIDPASHAYRGKTERNSALFGPVGHAYVYFTYGIHYCLNFVSRVPESPAGGVLIRAVEPLLGIDHMYKNRKVQNLHLLTNGPGKLTQALEIGPDFNHIDITKKGPLYVLDAPEVSHEIVAVVTRIGISQAKEHLWRFYEKGNKFISKK